MLLALAAAPALLVGIPEPVTFGDWLVACDNLRRCEAVALPRDDKPDSQLTLSVVRDAAASATPEVEVGGAFGDDLPSGSWRIDGRRVVLSGMALLRTLAKAHRAEWVLASGKVHATLPVAGAAAALRWLDDQQKRAGTVTALIATGPASASTIPPPPQPPRIATPPISTKQPHRLEPAAVTALRDENDCAPDRPASEFHRLDAAHSLAIIGCTVGAYQGTSLILVGDERGRWAPAPIEWPARAVGDPNDPWSVASVMSPDFDPKTRALASWSKGRGLGDCGYSASWMWDGKAFRLASFGEMNQCRGSQAWPSRWQTANVLRR